MLDTENGKLTRQKCKIEIGSTTIRKLDLENIGVAVGILSLCALEI